MLARLMPPAVTPHTQLPNLLQDFVIPFLKEGEVKTLLYVVRHTIGYSAVGGGRKEYDRISLSQFEFGVRTSGGVVLDVGTRMSRTTIIKALTTLRGYGIIEQRLHCAKCLWEETDGGIPTRPDGSVFPDDDDERKQARCPRCSKTLDRAFALAKLTPRHLKEFLCTHDGRDWDYDHELRRFILVGEEDESSKHARRKVDDAEMAELRSDVWYPDLLDKMLAQRRAAHTKAITNEQQARYFYRATLELQALSTKDPAHLRYVLEQVIDKRICQQQKLKTGHSVPRWAWFPYAKSILERIQLQGLPAGIGSESEMSDLERAEQTARDLLLRAAELNEAGGDDNIDAGRKILSELLGITERLAPIFAGNEEMADAHVRLAFKLGVNDLRAAADAISPFDHYPEWNWPTHLE